MSDNRYFIGRKTIVDSMVAFRITQDIAGSASNGAKAALSAMGGAGKQVGCNIAVITKLHQLRNIGKT